MPSSTDQFYRGKNLLFSLLKQSYAQDSSRLYLDANGLLQQIVHFIVLMDPLLRDEPKTDSSSEKVQAVDIRTGNQEVTVSKKPQREVKATEQKLLNNG